MYAVSYLLYYLTNHFSYLPPQRLPMTWIDLHTPLMPYSVLIYISEYFYFAFVYILLNEYDNINRYLYSFFFLQVVSCLIFIIYPSIYPRELYPIPNDIPIWLQSTWIWLRNVDAPTNCFPSLHVSSVYLSALVFITDKQMKLFWLFFIWATLISASTLTTKQHYLADIISGITISICFYGWFHLRTEGSRTLGSTN